MGKPGIIAFPVLLVLGAITGYLTYTYFTAAIPQPGIVESPYRQELRPAEASEEDEMVAEKVEYAEEVTIKILFGSLTQGNPDYDPDAATAGSDSLITWVNEDSTLHTATSGTGTSDPESGKLFDSKFLAPEGKYSIAAEKIGPGEHAYYCTVHPFMTATITIK